MSILDRAKSAWNVFRSQNNDGTSNLMPDLGMQNYSYSNISPSRPRYRYNNERTIISAIYNRISVDVSNVVIKHIQLDSDKRYLSDINSNLNDCLTLEPNVDQGPRAFRQDLVMTLFDRGVAAIVPVDTTVDPTTEEVMDIYSLRVGNITAWYPKHVQVSVYNEELGYRQAVTLPKRAVAIVENPFYSVMNEPNSTLKRLIRKLTLLDTVDEASGSGKLDLIIQLPYVIKSEARKDQAEKRREDIEFQLTGSKYGIAYTDSTEKITQLNRPVENNLLAQVQYLTTLLYSQLGITEEIMNGTASETSIINYNNRTIEPIIDAIVEAMQRSFIGPMRTSKLEKIHYFMNLFRLVPITQLAELADKFSRNEILTSNEFRQLLGFRPSTDPRADQLRNSNLRVPTSEPGVTSGLTAANRVANKPLDPLKPTTNVVTANKVINKPVPGLNPPTT